MDLYGELEGKHGLGRDEAVKLISILMKDSSIFMPRPSFYRRL